MFSVFSPLVYVCKNKGHEIMRTLKRMAVVCLLTLISLPVTLFATSKRKDDIVKTGINFGILPVLYYNTDLGFEAGVMGQIFQYGDGSIYPNYFHKLTVVAGIYTKGAKQFDVSYDSKYLIPRKRITANLQYFDSPLNGFFGFNGAISPYYSELNLKRSESTDDGIAFYSNHQKLFNSSVDIQGRIIENMTWITGAALAYHDYSPVNFRKYYNGEESLYFQYLQNGLISSQDTHGFRAEAKAGVIYDTRDFEPNPFRGLFASVTILPGASFSDGKAKGSLMLSVSFNQYLCIIPSRLIFAYQLSYQGLIAGSLPFYSLPAFAMRGSFGRRIVGNGIAKACTDIRLTAARFHIFNQNVELGLVGFAEAGGVVQPHRVSDQRGLEHVTFSKTIDGKKYGPYKTIYDPSVGSVRERLHSCAGGGFFFAINKNFLVSMQLSHPMNIQDGGNGIYINLGFSF